MPLNIKNVNYENTNINIIGSTHEEKKAFSNNDKCRQASSDILNKLNKINPEVIFIELPSEEVNNISKFENASPAYSSVELVAVAKYISNKNVDVIGVDSKSLRELNQRDSSDEMINMSRLTRNNAIAYNTLIHLRENKINNCVLIIGKNHMNEVIKILS